MARKYRHLFYNGQCQMEALKKMGFQRARLGSNWTVTERPSPFKLRYHCDDGRVLHSRLEVGPFIMQGELT